MIKTLEFQSKNEPLGRKYGEKWLDLIKLFSLLTHNAGITSSFPPSKLNLKPLMSSYMQYNIDLI